MWEEVWAVSGFVAVCTFTFWGWRKLVERRSRRSATHEAAIAKSGHQWEPEDSFERGFYCSLCENHLISGYRCHLCNLMVDEVCCMRTASVTIPCKVNIKSSTEKELKHHWVWGNLLSNEFCEYCGELCGGGVGLADFRCTWCARCVHADCKRRLPTSCDCGTLKQSIIPPNRVTMRKAGNRGQKQMTVDSVTPPENVKDWHPIIVIANPKSGSGAGSAVMRSFRNILHPIQVVDVTKSNMKATLRWLDEHPEVKAKVLIAGGDGTISFVLNDIDALANRPRVAVLPLGTGNDLSRVLGWGKQSDGKVNVMETLKDIQEAKSYPLDRWIVSIEHVRKLGVRRLNKSMSMTNYVSIGVDACVTFGMQSTRQQLPRALSSRLLNKFLFFTYGTKDVFERACRGLEKRIELTLNDNIVQLPEIEGLIFLNITCWGAGVEPWKMEDDSGQPQSECDGKFEVFAVRSSFHIAQLQMGLSSPIRIGQASRAILRVKKGQLPMQCDGEAWLQQPAVIHITHKGVSNMLSKKPAPSKSGYYL